MAELTFFRFLQSNEDQERNFNRFAAFIFWYILLLLCCAVPTVCAYRRRRRLHARIERITHLQRMAANGVVNLGNSMPDGAESEESRDAKMRKIQAAIKDTTMTVASKHLLRQQDSQRIDEEAGMDNINLEESELEFAALQLSGEHPNGNTQVPALCAICLCSYELDDSVTYSPNRACRHAFHTECISTWITKKETPLCPCCRQEFCSLD